MTLGIPSTLSFAAGSITTVANDAQLANSLLVTGTIVRNGQSYRYSRVVGARQPSPFVFAIMTKGDVNFPKALTLGANGWGGDIFSDGKITIGPAGTGSVINGNLGASVTASGPTGITVTGRTLNAQPLIAWPSPSGSNYSNAVYSLIGSGLGKSTYTNATLTSVTFVPYVTGSDYNLWYFGNNLTVSGTISGRGTIYVSGNLTISGNLRYASSSDEVAFVVAGNITVNSSVSAIDGFYFTSGNLSASQPLSVSRGAIVANGMGVSQTLSVVRDDAVMNDETEAVRLRLPYYWP